MDLKVLNRLRILLKDENYSNISFSNILGSNITLTFWQGWLSEKPRKKNILLLSYLYFLFFKDVFNYFRTIFFKKKLPTNKNPLSNQIIIEALSDESRVKNLWFPIAEKLGKGHCLVLTPDDKSINQIDDLNYICLNNLNLNNLLSSRLYILKNTINWYRKIGKLKNDFPFLNTNFRIEIILILVTQINIIEKAEYFHNMYKPKSYVSVYDWYYLGSVFCSVFKKYNTPTYTFVHGAVGKKSMCEFVPLNAQYVFTWGSYSSKLFLEGGTPMNNILPVGIQRMEEFKPKPKSEILKIKKEFKVCLDQNIILLAFTAVITESWKRNIDELFELLPDFFFICRPHPSTDISEINQLIPSDNNNIIVLSSKQISLEDCIAISDIIIVDSSTAGFDAIIQNKPVFVLDADEPSMFQDVMLDAVENNAAILCNTTRDLSNQLKKWEKINLPTTEFNKNRKRFVKDYIYAYGNEAVKNVIEILNPN